MTNSFSEPQSEAQPASWTRAVAFLAQWGSLLALVGATLCTFGAARWWAFELSTHFEVQYLIGSTCAFLLAGFRRSLVGLLLAGVLCGVHGGRVLALQGDAVEVEAGSGSEPALRLLLSNVQTSNQDSRSLLSLIADEGPDVICLLEVDRRWLDDLQSIETTYPHFERHPRNDNFGIAIYSKIPFEDVDRIDLGTGAKPSIRAQVEHAGRPLHILVTHPVPPIGRYNGQSRDGQIEDLAHLARDLGSRTVIAGDLNATPWTPAFEQLLDTGNVRDSMQGYGVHATWPARWPSWLRIPIDHILLGEDVMLLDRRVGPFTGSDHRPVIVDLR